MTHTASDNLSLSVINDGAGDICGASYKYRCEVFQNCEEYEKASHALKWVCKVEVYLRRRGYVTESAREILNQAAEVCAYYSEHVKELVA